MNSERPVLHRYPETQEKAKLREELKDKADRDRHFFRLEEPLKEMVIDTIVDLSEYTDRQLLETVSDIRADFAKHPKYGQVEDYMQFRPESWYRSTINKHSNTLQSTVASGLVHKKFMDILLRGDELLAHSPIETSFEYTMELCDKLTKIKTHTIKVPPDIL